ncbi:MAG: hypothetical protein ABII90_04045 [Bacteroidota bacterium]
MKKISALLVIVFFALAQLTAQEPTFVKGDKVLNLGLGLGSTLYTGTYYKSRFHLFQLLLNSGLLITCSKRVF